jgi:hypothetical protein
LTSFNSLISPHYQKVNPLILSLFFHVNRPATPLTEGLFSFGVLQQQIQNSLGKGRDISDILLNRRTSRDAVSNLSASSLFPRSGFYYF